MSNLRQIPVPPSWLEPSFAWTPATTYTFTAHNGTVIAAPRAAHNTDLTFTATVVIGNQGNDITGPLSVVEYYWDFGDGIIGYGNPVHHTYALANLQAATKLKVTDSKGRAWWTRAQMYLS